jgi:hypothetical protein
MVCEQRRPEVQWFPYRDVRAVAGAERYKPPPVDEERDAQPEPNLEDFGRAGLSEWYCEYRRQAREERVRLGLSPTPKCVTTRSRTPSMMTPTTKQVHRLRRDGR